MPDRISRSSRIATRKSETLLICRSVIMAPYTFAKFVRATACLTPLIKVYDKFTIACER
ncbi:hypothetical protein XHV734_0755 [Xanthomonas hortorum pv. vitians]|nr:hypothetical protein XHV734_0755 [Xanthomonas hortorum pv. vitians]